MKGVSFEQDRQRWRCFHRSDNQVHQPRFPTKYEAVWKKIELCANDGTFPYTKSVKEGPKSDTDSKTINTLPIGIREHYSKSKQSMLIIASLPLASGYRNKEYRYTNPDDRELIIKQATWERFECCWQRLLAETKHYSPVKKNLLETLRKAAELRTQAELDRHFRLHEMTP